MIFTDESSKSVVLAVRGTYSLADVIVDIICDEEKFLDGYAHRGILKGANRIMKESGDILKEALAGDNFNPNYKLLQYFIYTITGITINKTHCWC